jgi:nicotinate-nucleotide adenylyltransferase
MKIGILGGTFDPVHYGHLAIAGEARDRLGLDKVLFMPAGQPWLKVEREITPSHHRVAMVQLAIKESPYFELSLIEVERDGPTYTVDTLRMLHRNVGSGVDFYFILGWDSLAEFSAWKEPEAIVKLCKLVAVTRRDKEISGLNELRRSYPDTTGTAIILDIPPVDISSSDIRNRVAGGLSVTDLVPGEVESYIARNQLYGSRA